MVWFHLFKDTRIFSYIIGKIFFLLLHTLYIHYIWLIYDKNFDITFIIKIFYFVYHYFYFTRDMLYCKFDGGKRNMEIVRRSMQRPISQCGSSEHDLEQLPRFILSESFIAVRLGERVGARWNSGGVIYCSRGARRARGVTSTSRICNKEDRCNGRNITPEANLLLYHSALSPSFVIH